MRLGCAGFEYFRRVEKTGEKDSGEGTRKGGEIGVAGAVTLALTRGEWGTTELIWRAAAHPSSRGLPGYELGVSRGKKRRLDWTASVERVSDGSVISEKRA